MYGFIGLVPTTVCDCGAILPLRVLKSNAGHYLGFFCLSHGPYSRETEYMPELEAQALLDKVFTRHGVDSKELYQNV